MYIRKYMYIDYRIGSQIELDFKITLEFDMNKFKG